MKKSEYALKSLINALGVFVYISGVALVMSNMEHAFNGAPTFIIPVLMLLLFVISASITGFLVLGRPIMLYLDGHKKEAFISLFSTLAWLILFVAMILTALWMF